MDESTRFAKKQFQMYFWRLAIASEAHRPPGQNAASADFTRKVISDPVIAKLTQSRPPNLTGAGLDLHQLFLRIHAAVQDVFVARGPHTTRISDYPKPLFDKIFRSVGALAAMVEAIVQATALNAAAAAEIVSKLKSLIKEVADSKTVIDGTHANGWIASDLRTALVPLQEAVDLGILDQTDRSADAVGTIVSTALHQVSTIKSEKHDPWLRAEWQIQFQAIVATAAAALAKIDDKP